MNTQGTGEQAQGWEGLGLGEADAATSPTPARASWAGKTVLFAVLACLMVAGVFGLYFTGRALFFPQTWEGGGGTKGECFVFDPTWCVSLDVGYVQGLAGIVLPREAEIVDSGASKFLFTGSDRATVRWPKGTPMPDHPASTGSVPDRHDLTAFDRVDAVWEKWDDRYYTIVLLGVGTDGAPVLQVTRSWDG